jgi:hypothetical protein
MAGATTFIKELSKINQIINKKQSTFNGIIAHEKS